MRHVLFASLMLVLAGMNPTHAQESEPEQSSSRTKAHPESLPPHPVPVLLPHSESPSPTIFAPPAQPLCSPAPTGMQESFADNYVDGFPRRFWISADYLLWWTK